MSNIAKVYETKIGGKKVVVETGKYCEQSNGSCIVRCGETVVMVNVTMAKQPRDGIDFFPLGVDFEEKMYSVGKIPGGYKRREGRPADKAILVSRLIDRPLRPLFPKGFYNDVSVVATALSVDPDVAIEPLAMLGSSIALTISDIPFQGPTGSVLVSCVDGKFIVNGTEEERAKSNMHLTVSGTHDAILMVEAGANEVPEDVMIDAIMFAHEEIKKQVEFQLKMKEEIGKPVSEYVSFLPQEDLKNVVKEYAYDKLVKALDTFDRHTRQQNQDEVDADVKQHFAEIYPDREQEIGSVLYALTKEIVRKKIINDGIRPDGRKLTEIRPIWCEVGVLPRVHGTGVFTRGQTQVLTTCTLGPISEAQEIEILDEDEEVKRYIHHYNMPPYSTGEAKPLRSPGRREIGHGALAERALVPVIPSEEEFPYAIRLVSEVLSSNGSSSMASTCGSTLALMDAGVPISAPVAGIAMGLIKDTEQNKVAVLSDIQGLEDFFGDMDFKVTGTTKGITAIQIDIKIKGIDKKILTTALNQAREGRLYIMDKMLQVISKPRKELSKYAPKIITFNINPDKIKDVIGSGGKVINKIIAETNVKIDIDDDGRVYISTPDTDMAQRAKEIILNIAEDFEVGKIYSGKVIKTTTFGAFVEVAQNKEGMIHISKLSDKKVKKVEDVVNVGDSVQVEVIKIDDKGRVDFRLVAKE